MIVEGGVAKVIFRNHVIIAALTASKVIRINLQGLSIVCSIQVNHRLVLIAHNSMEWAGKVLKVLLLYFM